MSRRTRTFYVEMTWTCESCRRDNRGHDTVCSKCGAPKTSSAKDRMPDALKEVTDKERLREAAAGPNWKCTYCGSEERDLRGECARCGGERFAAYDAMPAMPAMPDTATFEALANAPQAVELDPGFEVRLVERLAAQGRAATPVPVEIPADEPTARHGRWWQLGVLAAGVAGIAGIVTLLDWCFAPVDRHVDVTATSWRSTADLERRQVNHGNDWREDMPSGAYAVSCEREEHGTHDCHAHDCRCHSVSHSETYDCRCHEVCHTHCSSGRNGYARCSESCDDVCSTCTRSLPSTTECDTCYDQCPTYDDYCSFTYDTWPVVEHEELSGSGPTPSTPVLRGPNSSDERASYSTNFRIELLDRDGHYVYSPSSVGDYDRFHHGDRWHIRTNHAGMVEPIAQERR